EERFTRAYCRAGFEFHLILRFEFRAVDECAVVRIEIGNEELIALACDLKMLPRDEVIGQHQRTGLQASDQYGRSLRVQVHADAFFVASFNDNSWHLTA